MYILSKTLSKNTFFNIQLKSMSTLSYTDFSKANGCLKLHNINTKLTILEGLLKFQRLRTNVIQQEMILRLLLVSCWQEKRAQIYISEHLLDVTTAKEKLWYNRAKKWLLISWWFHLRVNKRTPYIGSQRNNIWCYSCMTDSGSTAVV